MFAQSSEEWANRAAAEILLGRWDQGRKLYEHALAAASAEGEKDLYLLRLYQIRYELGDMDNLPGEVAHLASRTASADVKRDSLLLEAKILSLLGYDDQALRVLEAYEADFIEDPVWLLAAYQLYEGWGSQREADRLGWLLRRDFPDSPEALILKGEARDLPRPSQLLGQGN